MDQTQRLEAGPLEHATTRDAPLIYSLNIKRNLINNLVK